MRTLCMLVVLALPVRAAAQTSPTVAPPVVVEGNATIWLTPPAPTPAAPNVSIPSTSAPAPARHWPAIEEPERERVVPLERTNWELIAPGIVGLVGGYVGWMVTTMVWNGANNECRGSTWGLFPSCTFSGVGPDGADIGRSFIPLVGPWLSIAESETMAGLDLLVPALAGIGQVAGLAMLIVGIAMPVSRDVELDVSGRGDGGTLGVKVRF